MGSDSEGCHVPPSRNFVSILQGVDHQEGFLSKSISWLDLLLKKATQGDMEDREQMSAVVLLKAKESWSIVHGEAGWERGNHF